MNIKLLAAELAFRADRKILQMEEEPYYRMDIAAHEKILNPWLSQDSALTHQKSSARALTFANKFQTIETVFPLRLQNIPIKEIINYLGVSSLIFGLLFMLSNTPAYTKIIMADIEMARLENAAPAIHLTKISDPWLYEKTHKKEAKPVLLKALEEAGVKQADGILPLNFAIASYDDRISIPSLDINVPLVTPSLALDSLKAQDWNALEEQIRDSLQKGVVYYPGTAEPGAKGNFFVTGHSSNYFWELSPYNTVFALLPKIKEGAEIIINYKQHTFRYIVTSKMEVKPDNVSILKQGDEHKMTLMTCTPVGTTLKRLVVSAELVK